MEMITNSYEIVVSYTILLIHNGTNPTETFNSQFKNRFINLNS